MGDPGNEKNSKKAGEMLLKTNKQTQNCIKRTAGIDTHCHFPVFKDNQLVSYGTGTNLHTCTGGGPDSLPAEVLLPAHGLPPPG